METETVAAKRETLNGCWILDKTKEPWNMNGYLEIMDVGADAIAAHEKAEKEHDTYHTIELTRRTVSIIKRSRVNNDLKVELELGREKIEYLEPNNRPKRMTAKSEGPQHLCIESFLLTSNGMAIVRDVKKLNSENGTLEQTLTVRNETTGKTHTTTRVFRPYHQTPPHLAQTEE